MHSSKIDISLRDHLRKQPKGTFIVQQKHVNHNWRALCHIQRLVYPSRWPHDKPGNRPSDRGSYKNGMKQKIFKSGKIHAYGHSNQFIMLNAIDMNPSPQKMPKTRQGAGPEELMNIYMEHMYAEQFKELLIRYFGHAVHTVLDIAGIDNHILDSWRFI